MEKPNRLSSPIPHPTRLALHRATLGCSIALVASYAALAAVAATAVVRVAEGALSTIHQSLAIVGILLLLWVADDVMKAHPRNRIAEHWHRRFRVFGAALGALIIPLLL